MNTVSHFLKKLRSKDDGQRPEPPRPAAGTNYMPQMQPPLASQPNGQGHRVRRSTGTPLDMTPRHLDNYNYSAPQNYNEGGGGGYNFNSIAQPHTVHYQTNEPEPNYHGFYAPSQSRTQVPPPPPAPFVQQDSMRAHSRSMSYPGTTSNLRNETMVAPAVQLPAAAAYTPQRESSDNRSLGSSSSVTPPNQPPIISQPQPYQFPGEAPLAEDAEDRLAILQHYDTVFVIDDSKSMAGERWRLTEDVLSKVVPIATTYDSNGVDIYFLNHEKYSQRQVKSEARVKEIFAHVSPNGSYTPTGRILGKILKAYLYEFINFPPVKKLNIIVITDGASSDHVASYIVRAAQTLDKNDGDPDQVGIQFVQIGDDPGATRELDYLDNRLAGDKNVRDMVDTVPWREDFGVDELTKVVLGGIHPGWDEQPIT